jgi:hypothetical protein
MTNLTLQSALERLLETYQPWHTCERIVGALHANRLRLYCEGALLSPGYIIKELRIAIEQEADGRWRWVISPAGPLGFAGDFDPRTAAWEVDEAGFKDLLPPPPKRAGRKAAHNWTDIADGELLRLRAKGSPLLEDFEPLCAHLKKHLDEKTGRSFKTTKRFRQRIHDFLREQIRL